MNGMKLICVGLLACLILAMATVIAISIAADEYFVSFLALLVIIAAGHGITEEL